MELIKALVFYLLGVIIAELLYRFGKFNRDHDVVVWSWAGVFVILLSLSSRYNH